MFWLAHYYPLAPPADPGLEATLCGVLTRWGREEGKRRERRRERRGRDEVRGVHGGPSGKELRGGVEVE